MQSSVRRAAHAFNMLRQIRVLQQCSKDSAQAHFDVAGTYLRSCGQPDLNLCLCLVPPCNEEWEKETSVCKAFNIGKTEAKAVIQLHGCVETAVREQLEISVRLYGMRAFIYHDVIAREAFSRGFCSATAGLEAWAVHLTNGSKDGDPLVPLSQALMNVAMTLAV